MYAGAVAAQGEGFGTNKGGHTVQQFGENDAATPVTGHIVVLAVPYSTVSDVMA